MANPHDFLPQGATRWLHTVTIAALFAGCTGEIGVAPDAGPGGGGDRPVDIVGPAVLPHVQAYANAACGRVGACDASTYEGHQPTAARALDILVSDVYGKVPTDGNARGDALAEFALAHQADYRITYVIWRQRINLGSGWEPMEDRGSITQNHYDHVHASFEESP